MSWEENIKNKISITTGDGAVYEPLTKIDSNTASFDFNVSEFEFPEIEGTKVDRRLRKGVRYPMELIFHGADCIDIGKQFVESSKNTNPWIVLHPIFGQFLGQPISIEMDATGINTFIVKVTVVETILEDGAKTVFDPAENAKFILNKSKETNNTSFENAITSFEPSDVVSMQENTTNLYNTAVGSITDQTLFNQYLNLYNTAQTKINNALNDALFGVSFVQDFINYPAEFAIGIKTRINIIENQLQKLFDSIDAVKSNFNEKKIFENNSGSLINTLVQAISNPIENDYQSAVDVYYIIQVSINLYNEWIVVLQELQSVNGYEQGAYLPNAEFLESIQYSFNYAISNLFIIGLNAQQERIIYLENDSNIIEETHRFYGLDQEDVNLQKFIKTNNIGLNETLELKKGRKLVYYI